MSKTAAEPGRIQIFLDENEWAQPAYDVQLPASVLSASYSLKNGSFLVWQKHGWRAIVRRIDGPGLQDADLEITALAVLTAE